MLHVLTLKVPVPLVERLGEAARREGKSKGAVVREAIERRLREGSEEEGRIARIKKITEAHRLGKRVRSKVDWDKLCEKVAAPAGMTPEEELRRSRRRGF